MRGQRTGFTLLELLIAIGILLILTALTVAVVNATLQGDRLRGASRQVQSYLEGARDRAIYAAEPRGVRFLVVRGVRNPAAGIQPDDSVATSMVFVGAPQALRDGTVTLTLDAAMLPRLIEPSDAALWAQLRDRRLLVDGTEIRITGNRYSMSFDTSETPVNPAEEPDGSWKLTKDYAGLLGQLDTYEVELTARVLPNQEPRLLPEGVVIDLDQSRLPPGWGTAAPYAPRLDVMFSPRGTVTGAVASAGLIHFVLATAGDAEREMPVARAWQPATAYAVGDWLVPEPLNYVAFQCTVGGTSGAGPTLPAEFLDPANQQPGATFTDADGLTWQAFEKGENLVVSLATQTGKVSTHPIWDNRTAPADPLDPFRYAETGETAR